MASKSHAENASHGKRKSPSDHDEVSDDSALRLKLSRKRTKTGCLTCRKRRIKCGEERPICRNCIKSKRHCEGYDQRVVFKQPAFDYRPLPNGAHIVFNSRPISGPGGPIGPGFDQGTGDQTMFSQLRPRPPEPFGLAGYPDPAQAHFGMEPAGLVPPMVTVATSFPAQPTIGPPGFDSTVPPVGPIPFHLNPQLAGTAEMPVVYPQQFANSGLTDGNLSPTVHLDTQWTAQGGQPGWSSTASASGHASPMSSKSSRSHVLNIHSAPLTTVAPWQAGVWVPQPNLSHHLDHQTPLVPTTQHGQVLSDMSAPLFDGLHHPRPLNVHQRDNPWLGTASTTDFLMQAAVETQDDDYFDVLSDEETESDNRTVLSDDPERQKVWGKILQINQLTLSDMRTPRREASIDGGVLDHYRVEEVANPLRNPATACLFAHFISVTGPSLSIFQRRPRGTSFLPSDTVPFSEQGIWTYTMPMAALRHQGLLHAMLALASLHIAKTRRASTTPSMQHYAWALKRIHHSVAKHTQSRLKLTTIAATMLLGCYEIMTADHLKWNTHLAGSKQLFLETDFVTMMRTFKHMKSERAVRLGMGYGAQPMSQPQDEMLDQIPIIDEHVLSQLAGRDLPYNTPTPPAALLPLDLKHFELLKDLYWCYLKHDAYQSIVSGNPLLLDYSLWSNCPPRAPLGQHDAVYGTFDHLILLLGRVAEFSARDRFRKLKVMEANGGQWRPSPGMRPPPQGPPSSSMPAQERPPADGPVYTPPGNLQGQPSPQGPQFYGMAPPPRQSVQMPTPYLPNSNVTTPQATSTPENYDIHAATRTALEEYGRIRAALLTFSHLLGPEFEPLGFEHQPPQDSPFGTALFYRSYDIGSLWSVYYMAVIIAIRSHPHMHPAAHVAAALAAQETSHYANEIGRIAAGMPPGQSDQPLNPMYAAALCESMLPSFFAAVQYQNPQQRYTTIDRMYNTGIRTGWASAEVIANGCETAWVKAAAAGRGPPYQRIVRREQSDDPRVSGGWEHLDPQAQPDGKDDYDRRLVAHSSTARLNWAIGILGTEHDEMMTSPKA